MQAFKTKWFARFARREHISNSSLREAIKRAERGLIDADVGGGLIKQRVGRQGQGRSGGYRVIVAYKAKSRAIFLLGFAKNEKENISLDELPLLRRLAQNWLAVDSGTIREETENGNLQSIEFEENQDDKEA
jgi:hypothetical protein